jgi:hypothetical protein
MFIRRHSVYNGGKEFGSNNIQLLSDPKSSCKEISELLQKDYHFCFILIKLKMLTCFTKISIYMSIALILKI